MFSTLFKLNCAARFYINSRNSSIIVTIKVHWKWTNTNTACRKCLHCLKPHPEMHLCVPSLFCILFFCTCYCLLSQAEWWNETLCLIQSSYSNVLDKLKIGLLWSRYLLPMGFWEKFLKAIYSWCVHLKRNICFLVTALPSELEMCKMSWSY